MRRPLVFATTVCAAAVGAWALPAGQAAPTIDPAGAELVVPAPPDVRAPLIIEPLVSAADQGTASVPEPRSSEVVSPAAAPEHLADDPPTVDAAPAEIVTTTTAPPTTAPPTTSAAPPPAVSVAFTAQQAYGSCGEDVPYDIFSGTADPGSTVTISSPYGSGTATADAHGHWERTVEFPSAPRGETFHVVSSGVGGSVTLAFTATGGAHA